MTENEMLTTVIMNALERFPGASGCEEIRPGDIGDGSIFLDLCRQELESLRKAVPADA